MPRPARTDPIPPNNLRKMMGNMGWSMESVAKFTRQSVATVSNHANRKRRMSEQVVKDYAELFSVMSAKIFVELNGEGEFESPSSDPEDDEPSLTTTT